MKGEGAYLRLLLTRPSVVPTRLALDSYGTVMKKMELRRMTSKWEPTKMIVCAKKSDNNQ